MYTKVIQGKRVCESEKQEETKETRRLNVTWGPGWGPGSEAGHQVRTKYGVYLLVMKTGIGS